MAVCGMLSVFGGVQGLVRTCQGWLGNELCLAREGAKKALRCFLPGTDVLAPAALLLGLRPYDPATFWKKVDENFKRLRRTSRQLS